MIAKLKTPVLVLLLLICTESLIWAQGGYNYCHTFNQDIFLEDSLLMDLDGEGSPDVRIDVYYDTYWLQNSATITSLKTNNANFSDVKLDDMSNLGGANYGFMYKKPYGINLNDNNTDVDFDYKSYLSYGHSGANPNQLKGDTGIICYRYNRGTYQYYDPDLFTYETVYLWCYGWIKLYVSPQVDVVKVISTCGCSRDDMYAGISLPVNTSIESPSNRTISPSIFPNPSNGTFTVSLETEKAEIVQLKVYDLLGQLIKQESPVAVSGTYTQQLNLTQMPKGIYLLQIKVGEESISKRIEIQQQNIQLK